MGAWEPPEDGARTHEVRSDHLVDNHDLGGNGDVQGAPAVWTSASKKPTDARSLPPWNEVPPLIIINHYPPPHHHHCHQASPPGQPNLTRWRSRWSSPCWPLPTSKTPTTPLQITLPNTWSVFFLFVLLNPNSRPYPDHPPPPAPFLQTKAPFSLSQTLPSFTPSAPLHQKGVAINHTHAADPDAHATMIHQTPP